MKIKDVVIKEADGTAYQHNTSAQQWRDYAALQKQGQGAQPAPKKSAPKKSAPKKSAPAADPNQAQIDAQNALNQQAVLQQKQNAAQAGAADAPDRFAGQAKTDAQTGQNNLGVEEPRQADTVSTAPAPEPTGQEAPSAELDRLKQLAVGQNTQNQAASQVGAGYAQAAQSQPAAQAAQPAPAPAASAPAPADTVAPAVKTGTGGTLTTSDGKPVTSRSADEIAWAQKQGPMGPAPGVTYPGAGNWDPKTGRSTAQQAQADKNWQGIKNFFGFGKKEQPAAAPQQGQAAQPAPAPSNAAAAMANMRESDDKLLAAIRKIK